MNKQPLNEMPFMPPIVTADNATVYAFIYGALGVAWLTGVLMDLPDTIRGKWNSMKRDYEKGKLNADAAKTEIRKFTADTLKSIPKHWSPQRIRHLKSLLKAAEALASAPETQGSQQYGSLVREIQAYVARWSKVDQQEAVATPADEMPGFFSNALKPLKRKTDARGNLLPDPENTAKSAIEKRKSERALKVNMADSRAEVDRLLKMKKTAEIDAMGFDPSNQTKEKDVVIILKRVVLGKPEFILKSNKKEVVPETSSLGGVTWAYAGQTSKKVVVNAVHSIRMTESLIERIVKRADGKYEVVSKDGDRSFGTYSSEEAAKKRLQQIEFFKHTKG